MAGQMTFSYSKYAFICIISVTVWIIFKKSIYTTLRLTIFKSVAAAPVLVLPTDFFIHLKCPQTNKLMRLLVLFAFSLSGGFFYVSSSQFFCRLLSDLSKNNSGNRFWLLPLTDHIPCGFFISLHSFIHFTFFLTIHLMSFLVFIQATHSTTRVTFQVNLRLGFACPGVLQMNAISFLANLHAKADSLSCLWEGEWGWLMVFHLRLLSLQHPHFIWNFHLPHPLF